MALTKCPECENYVSDKAKVCPHCGVELTWEKKELSFYLFVGILILIIAIGYIYKARKNDHVSSTESNTIIQPSRVKAYSQATNYIIEQLSKPGAAKFPEASDWYTHTNKIDDGVYEIKSWVISINDDNIQVKNNFTCTVTFNGHDIICENINLGEPTNLFENETKSLKEIQGKARILYEKLLSFKGKKDFHTHGFGEGGNYSNWMDEVKSLRGSHEEKLLQLRKGILFGDIEMLGMEYLGSEGKETDYSREMKSLLKKALY